MKTIIGLVFVCLISLVVSGCSSTRAARSTPASARVTFENERVRVIEYHTGSEKDVCGFGMHTHPAHLYIMKTDAKLRIVDADGKESFEGAKAGDTGWAPEEKHVVENLSGNNASCYLIEIKDKDWRPSTGLKR